MNILNFGSLNLDHVYRVERFVQPGQTIAVREKKLFLGGKGLNQSLALARSGAEVYHAGVIGPEGGCLREALNESDVHVEHMGVTEQPQGHAIIQVDGRGENSIIVYGGSNLRLTETYIEDVLARFGSDTCVLLQNETSNVSYTVRRAWEKGMQVALNPSPITEELLELDFSKLRWLLVNQQEGQAISGQTDTEDILAFFEARYPNMGVVLTLGGAGAVCSDGGKRHACGAYSVEPVDTTGAGDTFTGYFIGDVCRGKGIDEALEMASAAAAIAVSREGAAPSIPWREEVERQRGMLTRRSAPAGCVR